jgi:hypothetical protein
MHVFKSGNTCDETEDDPIIQTVDEMLRKTGFYNIS